MIYEKEYKHSRLVHAIIFLLLIDDRSPFTHWDVESMFSHERSNNAIINLYSDLDILQAMSGVGGEVAIPTVSAM